MPDTNKESFCSVFLKEWCPAIITGLVGGLMVAWVAPKFQNHYAEVSAIKQRHIQLWESVGGNFTHYISSRSALNTVARQEQGIKGKPSEEFRKRKEEYRSARDQYRILLTHDLVKAGHYFGKDIKTLVDDYFKWHNQFATATVDKLPGDNEYEKRRDEILNAIGAKIRAELGGQYENR